MAKSAVNFINLFIERITLNGFSHTLENCFMVNKNLENIIKSSPQKTFFQQLFKLQKFLFTVFE